MQAHGVHGNNSATNVITFVVDHSASSHTGNHKNNFYY